MNSKFKKNIVYIIMALLILAFMYVFFTNMYPLIVYDTDDWTYISAPRSLIPIIHGWNPARVLPETLMPLCGSFAAYFIYPITHDYLGSLTTVNAFAVALSISLYIYFFAKMITKVFSLKNMQSVLISVLFLVMHFLLFVSSTHGNQHMFIAQDVTCYFFYLIPNLLNFIIVFIFMGKKNIKYDLNFSNPLKLGILLLILYVAIFSNLYCSIILAAYAGSYILINFFKEIKNKFNIMEFVKNNFLLFGIVGTFILSALFELTGGRSTFSQQGDFLVSLKIAFSNLKTAFMAINKKALIFFAMITLIFITVFIYDIIKKNNIKKYQNLFISLIICSLVLAFYFIFLSAKVNYNYILYVQYIYGLWAYILVLLFMMFTYLLKRFPKLFVILPLLLCFYVVEYNKAIKTFSENDSQLYKNIGNDLIEQVTSAEKSGNATIYLHVPYYGPGDNWPHATYLGDRISRTLYRHNITKSNLTIIIVPDLEYNKKFNLQLIEE